MIRRMEAADLIEVAELEKVCFTESWSYKLLEEGLPNPFDHYFVFEREGRIIGYSVLRLLADEGEIQRIAVLPQWRRQGTARKLMEVMVSHARKKQALVISLEVRAGNYAARRLYESLGFTQESLRKGYYHNPVEDAVIMWKRGMASGDIQHFPLKN